MDGSIEQLLSVDAAVLDLDDRLSHLEAIDALLARVSARRERALAAVATPDDERNWIREEVGCLLHWPFAATADRLVRATHLVERLPATLALHEAGRISDDHTRVLAEATYGLDPKTIRTVEVRVLDRAPTQTRAQFRQSVRRAVAAADTRTADDAHQAARTDRTVRLHPLPDGMAALWSVHTATDAEAVMARLRGLVARRRADDDRTSDQRRADALVACVLGGDLGGVGPAVAPLIQLLVPVDTDGTVVDQPDRGDRSRYRPTAAAARRVRNQWRTCRFPGCNRRASSCDLDHIDPFDGSNTTELNLQPLCVRHHHVKHDTGWTVRRRSDGTTEWNSPTGRRYEKPPDEWPRTA